MMALNGLAKLVEEAGEVIQVAGKLMAYPDKPHPDGGGDLKVRLEMELADLTAAIRFVVRTHDLDGVAMDIRTVRKLATFEAWHARLDN